MNGSIEQHSKLSARASFKIFTATKERWAKFSLFNYLFALLTDPLIHMLDAYPSNESEGTENKAIILVPNAVRIDLW